MTRININAGIFLFAFSSLAHSTCGQFISSQGGRASGMANTSLLLHEEHSLFNNPGALEAENMALLLSYNTRYISLGINDMQLGLVLPLQSFKAGVGITYYGDELFNHLQLVTGGVHKVGFANLGMRVSYHQLSIENYGYRRTATIDIGGSFNLSDEIKFGVLINNLTRSKVNRQEEYRLSSLLAFGISYQPLSSIRLDIQFTKNIDLPVGGSLGIEYLLNNNIAVRTGFDFTSTIAALGFGLLWQQFKINLAAQYQPQLGYTGVISIIIKRKNVD